MDGDELAVGEQAEERLDEGQNAAALLGVGDGGLVHVGDLRQTQPTVDGVDPIVAGDVVGLQEVKVLRK